MINEKELRKIIIRVLEKTNRKELDWQNEPDNRAFVCTFPRSSIVLSRDIYLDIQFYIFSILNESGDVVGTLNTRDCNPALAEAITTLYKLAERHALSIDETLEDILSNLD